MGIPIEENILIILEGCKKGARESQKELYQAFYGYAFAICSRYSRNQEDNSEVVNDGFVKVFRNIEKFEYRHSGNAMLYSFQSWIKKIMVYTAVDYYRAHQKFNFHQEITENVQSLSSAEPHPLEEMSYLELIEMVQSLSPAYRTVFNLFVLDGFSHEEIANHLGISVGTSKSNLAKARENLRKMLKKNYETLYARYE
ncbi:MAG: RNA polymerase sigma factor [Chitinophagaceae bacterium]